VSIVYSDVENYTNYIFITHHSLSHNKLIQLLKIIYLICYVVNFKMFNLTSNHQRNTYHRGTKCRYSSPLKITMLDFENTVERLYHTTVIYIKFTHKL